MKTLLMLVSVLTIVAGVIFSNQTTVYSQDIDILGEDNPFMESWTQDPVYKNFTIKRATVITLCGECDLTKHQRKNTSFKKGWVITFEWEDSDGTFDRWYASEEVYAQYHLNDVVEVVIDRSWWGRIFDEDIVTLKIVEHAQLPDPVEQRKNNAIGSNKKIITKK